MSAGHTAGREETSGMSGKCTVGEWTIHFEPGHTFSDGEIDKGGYRIDAPNATQLAFVWVRNKRFGSSEEFGTEEAEFNARLIAEAGTVLHETGLSPRQLAEQRDQYKALARELSEALRKVRPMGGSELFRRFNDAEFYADPVYCGNEIDRIRAELHEERCENARQSKQAAEQRAELVEAGKPAALLLSARLSGSDHPGATVYVLNKLRAALSRATASQDKSEGGE